jgi:hypothetical protein
MEDGVEDDSEVVRVARATAEEWLVAELPKGALERRPVHWPLVFPEVFSLKGGFDAIIGNPPFLGGKKITPSQGQAYREYLVSHVAHGLRGNADLVAYFELRAHQLLCAAGQSGLIATNSLAQGESREVSLDPLTQVGVEIRRAIKSAPWPSSSAMLEYCAVWTSKAPVGAAAERVLGGIVAPQGISTSLNLNTRQSSWAEGLQRNSYTSFQGAIVLGLGFTLSPQEAQSWISTDQIYADVLFPYLNGQDVSSHPEHGAERYIINFGERREDQAREYPLAFERVHELVQPERITKDPEKYPRMVHEWWKFWNARPGLNAAISEMSRCIVVTRVSKVVMPVMVDTGQVFSEQLVVFASDDPAFLALLASAPHYWWAIDRSSTLETRIRYTPTEVFETFACGPLTPRLRAAGARLDTCRRNLMVSRSIGLTGTYNLVHDLDCLDADIVELRHIHEEIDKATVEAYGWDDLLDDSGNTSPTDPTHETFGLEHGFHETEQGLRYTIGLLARTEIIDRLRQLNHQAYADEVHLGLHKGVTEKKAREKHPDLPPPSPEAIRKRKEQLAARGGADFGEGAEGALF